MGHTVQRARNRIGEGIRRSKYLTAELKKALMQYKQPETFTQIDGRRDIITKMVEAGAAPRELMLTLIGLGINGNLDAIRLIFDRIEGKPEAQVNVTGEVRHFKELTDAEIAERLERLQRIIATVEGDAGEEGREDVPALVHHVQ